MFALLFALALAQPLPDPDELEIDAEDAAERLASVEAQVDDMHAQVEAALELLRAKHADEAATEADCEDPDTADEEAAAEDAEPVEVEIMELDTDSELVGPVIDPIEL